MTTYERYPEEFDSRSQAYEGCEDQTKSVYNRGYPTYGWDEGETNRSQTGDDCSHHYMESANGHRGRAVTDYEHGEDGYGQRGRMYVGNGHEDFYRRDGTYERSRVYQSPEDGNRSDRAREGYDGGGYGRRDYSYEGYEGYGQADVGHTNHERSYNGYRDDGNGNGNQRFEENEDNDWADNSYDVDGRTGDGYEDVNQSYDGYNDGEVGDYNEAYDAYEEEEEDIGRRSRVYDTYGDELPVEFGRRVDHTANVARKRRKTDDKFGSTHSGVEKYHAQRYRLFSRFDEGVKMDKVSWYSVTPEKIAIHIAERFQELRPCVIVDAFCGAAGNAIQFAKLGALTIAVELCQSRIEIARNNAQVYGVERNIEFVNGNAYHVLPALKGVDAVFLSPPWGGPMYQDGPFQLSVFSDIVNIAKKVTPNVAILVPKHISHADALYTFGPCEIEENFLGPVLKTITIYFGGLMRPCKSISS